MKSLAVFIFLFSICVSVHSQTDSIQEASGESILSRFAIGQTLVGPSIPPTLNIEYRAFNVRKWSFDAKFGIGGLFNIPPTVVVNDLGIAANFGGASSKLRIGIGSLFYYTYGREHLDWDEWSEPRFHNQFYLYYFSLGYRFEHKHGFIFGVDAMAIGNYEKDKRPLTYISDEWPIHPWGGMTFGYRFPSRKTHQQWKSIKRDKRENKRLERKQIVNEKRDEKPEKELERLEKESLRELTGHAFYFEGLGAGLIWSFNYEYSLSILPKKKLLYLYGRIGLGGHIRVRAIKGSYRLPIPVMAGIRVMKNFAGGGIAGGVVPALTDEGFTNEYAFNADFQIHVGKGVLVGAAVFVGLNSPFYSKRVRPWGGLSIGYRVREIKKDR